MKRNPILKAARAAAIELTTPDAFAWYGEVLAAAAIGVTSVATAGYCLIRGYALSRKPEPELTEDEQIEAIVAQIKAIPIESYSLKPLPHVCPGFDIDLDPVTGTNSGGTRLDVPTQQPIEEWASQPCLPPAIDVDPVTEVDTKPQPLPMHWARGYQAGKTLEINPCDFPTFGGPTKPSEELTVNPEPENKPTSKRRRRQ